MYGGDEVSAIVVDLGSHTCKAGYAGEDAPKADFPSVVGAIDDMDVDDAANTHSNTEDAKNDVVESDKEKGNRWRSAFCHRLSFKPDFFVGYQALHFRRDQMEILSPMKDGIVADWDLVYSVWEHTFSNWLMIDPKEHPMLLAEHPLNPQHHREKSGLSAYIPEMFPVLGLCDSSGNHLSYTNFIPFQWWRIHDYITGA